MLNCYKINKRLNVLYIIQKKKIKSWNKICTREKKISFLVFQNVTFKWHVLNYSFILPWSYIFTHNLNVFVREKKKFVKLKSAVSVHTHSWYYVRVYIYIYIAGALSYEATGWAKAKIGSICTLTRLLTWNALI